MDDRYWLDADANKLFNPDLKPVNNNFINLCSICVFENSSIPNSFIVLA